VIPHPFAPILASYGIESTAKLWGRIDGHEVYEEEIPADESSAESQSIDEELSRKMERLRRWREEFKSPKLNNFSRVFRQERNDYKVGFPIVQLTDLSDVSS
jgi:hypothetical protein